MDDPSAGGRPPAPPPLFPPAITNHLDRSRLAVEGRIAQLYPEPHASLLIGLLTGTRSTLPPAVLEDFRDTGLTHILAISGYNITLVVTLLSGFFFWLPLRWRFFPSVLGIIAFTLFTGASSSVVRAAIMGILSLFALQSGRVQTIRLTILWAMFLMLLWNPRYLWDDAGFHLSFLAVIALVEISPLMEFWCRRIPDVFGLRSTLQTTLAVQILTTPWICYLFGRLSLIAPLSNLLAPPLVPIAMLTGALSLILHLIMPALGLLMAVPAYLSLSGLLLIAQTLAVIPLASTDLKLSQPLLLISYGLIIAWRAGSAPTNGTSEHASSIVPREAVPL
jgi:competence protein ComEC